MTVTLKNNPYNLTHITDTLIPLDKLNQSKALETGNVSSDKDVYADVLKYAHSTFDASKFTVAGTPTITEDGIASGFTARKSYVYIPCDLSSAESWRIRIRQKFIDGNTSCPVAFCSALNNTSEIFRLQFNNVNQRLIVIGDTPHTILKQFPDLNTYYDFEISYNGSEMSVETFKNNISVQKETFEQENIFNVNGYIVIGGSLEANTANAQNLIDLKYFLAKKDNMPFLSGNKTGTYEYKQENQEKAGIVISIPYTESKTGSMIADAIYRDCVGSMYEQYGYAPFYTIDEDNKNFTLPMGELYGFINRLINLNQRPSAELNGTSITFAEGFIVQGGWVAAPYGGTTVYFPKPMSSVWAVVAIDAADSAQNIETSVGSVTTTNFRVRNLAGHGVYWIAIGTK